MFLGAADGPWVATWMTSRDDGGAAPGSPTWRALNNGDRIKGLVSSLGLLGRPRSNDAGTPQTGTGAGLQQTIVGADGAGAVDPADTAPADPRGETRWFTLTGWRWAVPGLLLGVFAGFRCASERRPRLRTGTASSWTSRRSGYCAWLTLDMLKIGAPPGGRRPAELRRPTR